MSPALAQRGAFQRVDAAPPALDDRRSLNAGALARLLAALHADPGEAAEEYERLRRALVKFFDWRGVWPADECADIALDRLALKLQDTDVQDVRKYAYGIARLVALERQRRPSFTPIDDVAPRRLAVVESSATDTTHDCFDRCLGELSEENRSVLLQYYDGERQAKITNRRRLATLLGLTENALRSRVQRMRDRLEACMRGCVPRAEAQTL